MKFNFIYSYKEEEDTKERVVCQGRTIFVFLRLLTRQYFCVMIPAQTKRAVTEDDRLRGIH